MSWVRMRVVPYVGRTSLPPIQHFNSHVATMFRIYVTPTDHVLRVGNLHMSLRNQYTRG